MTSNAPQRSGPVRQSLFNAPTARSAPSEAFPIKVMSYNTADPQESKHTVTGQRLDNGEVVTVSLGAFTKKPGSAFDRPSVKVLSSPREYRNDPGTEIGGILLVEDASPVAPGVYVSRWLRSLSHTATEAEVMIVTAHVSNVRYSKESNGKPFASITFLHDGNMDHLSQDMMDALKLTSPGQVTNLDELRGGLMDLLDAGVSAGVRVSNESGFDGMFLSPKQGVSTEERVNEFVDKVFPAELIEQIERGGMVAELIPFSSVWAGPKTVDAMNKNAIVKNRLARYHDQERVEGRAREYINDVNLFRPTVVAMRLTDADEHGNRAVYFTHFEPMYTRQPVVGLRNAIAHAETELLAPEPDRPDHLESYKSRQRALQESPAATSGNAPAGYDDSASFGGEGPGGGVSEEEIMAAAGGPDEFEDAPTSRPVRNRPR